MVQKKRFQLVSVFLALLCLSAQDARCETAFAEDGAIWLPQIDVLPDPNQAAAFNANEKQIFSRWTREHSSPSSAPTAFEQEQFVLQFQRYARNVHELRAYLKMLSEYSGSVSADWMQKDSRILPFVKNALTNNITLKSRDVARCHQALAGMVSPQFLHDIDLMYAPGLSWNAVNQYAARPVFSEPYDGFDMRTYSGSVIHAFWEKLVDAKIGPQPGPLLLVRVERGGNVSDVQVMETLGDQQTAHRLVKIAAELRVPPLPSTYKGDHWYVLLRQDPTPVLRSLMDPRAVPADPFWHPTSSAPVARSYWSTKPAPSVPLYAAPANANATSSADVLSDELLSREQQEKELKCKQRVFGIKYPWEMVTPYASDWTRRRLDVP